MRIERLLRAKTLDHGATRNAFDRGARAALCALLVVATPVPPAAACYWDSDTLAMESRAFPGLAEILTGRIVREPARYYEMRIDRVRALVAANPGVLEHYDDLGVACDRLGRSDEAIRWMEKKAEAMQAIAERAAGDTAALAALDEHRYRSHANLGTFYAHRAIRSGTGVCTNDRTSEDLIRAREEIKAAIAINPDAHFGREVYQLAAIEWIIDARANPTQPYHSIIEVLGIGGFDCVRFGESTDAAVKGLAGLIVLGDAWQSIDVHYALELALMKRRDSSMALLAQLRRHELEDAGRESLHSSFSELRGAPARGYGFPGGGVEEREMQAIRSFFVVARESARTWSAARARFMEARFEQGIHPDTHGDAFWAGWNDEPPMPELPDRAWYEVPFQSAEATLVTVLATALCAGLIHIGRHDWKRRANARR
jgi:tetratricopeptide (TPR) repeat protein